MTAALAWATSSPEARVAAACFAFAAGGALWGAVQIAGIACKATLARIRAGLVADDRSEHLTDLDQRDRARR